MRLIHQHLGSGEGIHKHESCRKGCLLVDASDLGKQEGSNSVHIVRLRVASPGDVHHVGVRFELARPIPETTQSIRTSPLRSHYSRFAQPFSPSDDTTLIIYEICFWLLYTA